MHGTFDYQAEGRADRSSLPVSDDEFAEAISWAALVGVVLVGLVIGAIVGLVTGVVSGLIPLC